MSLHIRSYLRTKTQIKNSLRISASKSECIYKETVFEWFLLLNNPAEQLSITITSKQFIRRNLHTYIRLIYDVTSTQ
jgi:hypothetical protein